MCMKKRTKTSSYIRKTLGLILAIIFLSSVGVLATNMQVEAIKIISLKKKTGKRYKNRITKWL